MATPGHLVAGRYRIEREIGKGGMAIVFEATELATDRRVALKRLNPSFATDRSVVARFEREARAVMQLQSENAVRVYGAGATERGVPYIAMELLDGFDLSKVRKEALTRPSEKSVDWILQAMDAIAEAHSVGIVHRDVKPHNLFVAKDANGRERVKVLDFGIAKAVSTDGQMTRTEEIIGSPSYMSPEQTKASKDVDDRTDIWALGVCLYELLTGVLPFAADSVAEIYSKILTHDPIPPATLRPGLSERLSAVVLRCLAKDRSERWPDVAVLAEELEPFGTIASRGSAAGIRERLRSRFEATAPPTPYPNADRLAVTSTEVAVVVFEEPTASHLLETTPYAKPAVVVAPAPAPPPKLAAYAVIGALAILALVAIVLVTRRESAPVTDTHEIAAPSIASAAAVESGESVTEDEPLPPSSASTDPTSKPPRTTHGQRPPRHRPVATPHTAPAPAPVPAPGPPAARY